MSDTRLSRSEQEAVDVLYLLGELAMHDGVSIGVDYPPPPEDVGGTQDPPRWYAIFAPNVTDDVRAEGGSLGEAVRNLYAVVVGGGEPQPLEMHGPEPMPVPEARA